MANVFLGIYLNQSIWYKLSNQTRFGAYIAIGGAFLTVLINYLFIPVAGYMASAWATLIVYGAQMVASYLLGQKYFPIRYNLRKFTLYLGTALAIYFITRAIHLPDNSFAKFAIHNLLILGFIGLVMFIEGIKLKRR
jgi:Na+-driven multidrug efflux pump